MSKEPEWLCPRCGDWTPSKGEICNRCLHDPHRQDTFLRKHGFAIVSRPNNGPAVWRDTNSDLHPDRQATYPHDEAVELVDKRRASIPTAEVMEA